MTNNNLFGIWLGKNAIVAMVDDLRLSYLRIKDDLLVSICWLNGNVLGVVYGHGVNFDAYADMVIKNPNGTFLSNKEEAQKLIINHSDDKVEYNNSTNELIYKMYDGTEHTLVLAEKIEIEDLCSKNPIDSNMSLVEKMALWNRKIFFYHGDNFLRVGIDTKCYSVLFNSEPENNKAYCRVGQNGYCDKGWAMRSTFCVRNNETRMIEDNLSSLSEYKPIIDCFVPDSCAFPSDGGWYWSIKEVTDNIIYFNGCGGATYEIQRKC